MDREAESPSERALFSMVAMVEESGENSGVESGLVDKGMVCGGMGCTNTCNVVGGGG